MSTEINKYSPSPDQVDLIRKLVAPKATNDELKLFLYACQRYGLDPLTRQIYCIHRRQWADGGYVEKMTIQTSIDGFRIIAERTGTYAGQDEPEWKYDNLGAVESAKVTIYRFRENVRYPAAVGVAFWSEYVQIGKDGKPQGLWAKMPRTMLAKVAEALALRKAFPQDLGGLYTDDEMSQADIQPAQPEAPKVTAPAAQQTDRPKVEKRMAEIPAPAVTAAPIKIPGYWYARTEKIRTKAELAALSDSYRDEISGNPDLQKFLRETYNKLPNQ